MFVVWFRMYPGDEQSKWPSQLLTDSRVEHRWDEPKTAGRWFLSNLGSLNPSRGGSRAFPQRTDALWDSYLLFDRDGGWNAVPSGLLSWGFTVMDSRARLARDFQYAIAPR